jgi:hypothetical protein
MTSFYSDPSLGFKGEERLFGKTLTGFTGFAPVHQLPDKDYNPFLKTLKVKGEIFIQLFIP